MAIATAAVLVVAGPPAALGGMPTPVLGFKGAFRGGKGFGAVKPKVVYLGGDPTGRVQSVRWRAWGSSRATGVGQGWCAGESVAAGHVCEASLHVSRLGTCHGRRAYRTLAFYFKQHGRWALGSTWNICGSA